MSEHHGPIKHIVFCANPDCRVHRIAVAASATRGEWIELPDGIVLSRSRVGEQLLCDACALVARPAHSVSGAAAPSRGVALGRGR